MTSALSTALAAFLYAALYRPLMDRYREWKNDPFREAVARRNWQGHYIPDLTIIRLERAVKIALIGVFLAGIAVLGVIFFDPNFRPVPVYVAPAR